MFLVFLFDVFPAPNLLLLQLFLLLQIDVHSEEEILVRTYDVHFFSRSAMKF
jgi:hypothetical protein